MDKPLVPDGLDAALTEVLKVPARTTLRVYPELPLAERFRAVEAAFSARFGMPDWPDGEDDWPSLLSLPNLPQLTVWNFDYYVLSLRVEAGTLVLQNHGP